MGESSYRSENEQLGMSLIRGLAKDLDGSLLMNIDQGTKLKITFRNHIED
jgi:two-component sensor histidine kinase